MFWLYIFTPLILALLVAAFVNWKTKMKYKKYNMEHELEEHLSDNNKINNAAAWGNAARNNHHSGGGGGS